MPPPRSIWMILICLGVLSFGCSKSSSGSSSNSSQGQLLSICFPDPNAVNGEPEGDPPAAAPLNQTLVLEFSATPPADQVSSQTVVVQDALGFPVAGSFAVQGRQVIFRPALPTEPLTILQPSSLSAATPGLLPAQNYTLRVGPQTWPGFLTGVNPELLQRFVDPAAEESVVLGFRTTDDPQLYWQGMDRRSPALNGLQPQDGNQLSPNLFGNPEGLFQDRRPLCLSFDGPLHPDATHLSGFAVLDLSVPSHPAGLSLGIEVRIRVNEWGRSELEIWPSGILPFGHLLCLEIPDQVQGLAEVGAGATSRIVAASYEVENAPTSTLRDVLAEVFDDTARRATDELQAGEVPAEWDHHDSNLLQASFAFEGNGELGPFAPAPPPVGADTKTLFLDTSRQSFPLANGSTPDAPHGTEIVGGVFSFTDIRIPKGVQIRAVGPNPLILTATGDVVIEGEFELSGRRGTDENSRDSAVAALPGGPPGSGGGRGGEGHPVLYWPPGHFDNLSFVSPPFGGRGWGPSRQQRTGGHGGQSGCRDRPDAQGLYATDLEISCNEVTDHNNGWKAPGGGGGSMLNRGKAPTRDGVGNIITDGQGQYLLRTPETHPVDSLVLLKGKPGVFPWPDGNPDNNFFGRRGEHQQFFGGQGGGAGGSGLDSYFCGSWCRDDSDPTNDFCMTEFQYPPLFASSVGDSRPGSGGGGGGVLVIQALGNIQIRSGAALRCRGGDGGGGEQRGCSSYAGAGGGGAGGALVLQSASTIQVAANAILDVAGGLGRSASATGDTCGNQRFTVAGAGGDGSIGILQLQVPVDEVADVDPQAQWTPAAWVDPQNLINPTEITPLSIALSTWYDLGRVIERSPAGTNPIFRFRGLDDFGRVMTDGAGNVLQPATVDLRCDYLGQIDPLSGGYIPGQEPRSNFIPPNSSITVEFQGAMALVEGSKEVDPDSLTQWSPDPAVANHHQFIRYRITFDLAADSSTPGPTSPRPTVQSLALQAEF